MIRWGNGRRYDLNGSLHDCKTNTNTRKVETTNRPLTLEQINARSAQARIDTPIPEMMEFCANFPELLFTELGANNHMEAQFGQHRHADLARKVLKGLDPPLTPRPKPRPKKPHLPDLDLPSPSRL